jgi:predicted MFS family arabinose efflux permease
MTLTANQTTRPPSASTTTTRHFGDTAARPASARRGAGWLGAGAALAVVGWGANQFSPLLLFYRAHLGLSDAFVDVTFGLYAVGLVPGLLIAGPLSDRLGRRRVVLFAVALSMLASLVLMFGTGGAAWLCAGRVLMGVASGSAFSAGATWVKELSSAPFDDAEPAAGARRASIAMTLGFGLGPLVAGALAQWAPAPGVLPYVVQLTLAALALPLTARTVETANATGALPRRRRFAGLRDRRYLLVVLPQAPWVFGGAAIAMVYVPGLTAGHVSGLGLAYAAAVVGTTALSGVLVAPVARRLARRGSRVLLGTGMLLVIGGVLADAGLVSLRTVGVWQPVLALPTAAVLGAGYGVLMVFGLSEVQRLAKPEQLAGMTAVFQAFTYLGFAAPFVLSELAAIASPGVLLLAVAALAVLTLLLTGWQERRTGGTATASR